MRAPMRIALPPAIDMGAFAGLDPAAAITDLAGETMGTRWRVRCVLPAGVGQGGVHGAIVARLAGLVAEMSHWAPDSVLSAFNRSAPGSWTLLPSDFARVMAQGLAIAAATGGAFDPTIGRLVDLWGFGPRGPQPIPDVAEVRVALAEAGWSRLVFDGDRLRQPGGLALDLSGIAKGHAVDAVADLLADRGIGHALVDIGGELAGRGLRPDGQPWWVDLETPPGATVVPLRIALHGLAVATSGGYIRGAHTLDPRTGVPIASGVVSASVIHPSALVADAWATALTVLGPDRGGALAAQRGIAARIVTEAGETISPALMAMIEDCATAS